MKGSNDSDFGTARVAKNRLVRRLAHGRDDAESLRRAAVVLAYLVILVVELFVWGIGHIISGSTALGMLFLGILAATIALAAAALVRPMLDTAAHMSLALALLALSASTYTTGGLRLTNVCPFLALILAAFFILGLRGVPWAVGGIATALAFQVGHWLGVQYPDVVLPEMRETDAFLTWLSSAIIVAIIAFLYERSRAVAVQRAADASLAKEEFLANVSHEIRAPLHVVLAMQRALADTELSDEQRRYVAMMVQSAGSLSGLLTDLLELTRARAGRLELVPEDFDPVATCEGAVAILRASAEAKGVRFDATISQDVPRWARGDASRLRQILDNIGNNAVKFTEQGAISLRLDTISEPWTLRFTFEDTGRGIPEAQLPRIFQSFTQADSSLSRPHAGAGLGLAITRRLVAQMDGSIDVQSVEGEGSTFTVVLPFGAPHSQRPAPPTGDTGEYALPHRLRILLVDDSPLSLEVGALMLRRLQCDVVVAESGERALALWEAESPDVVLMDLHMPMMDGLAVSRQIRQREHATACDPVPIIALTGYATDDSHAACAAAGMDGCLFKPFSLESLRAALRPYA